MRIKIVSVNMKSGTMNVVFVAISPFENGCGKMFRYMSS